VNCDYTVQKLLEKELIMISGRNEHHPGQPLIYSTSSNFMDYFGINSPEDLPKLREIAEEEVSPTVMKNTLFGPEIKGNDENDPELSVTQEGELIINSDLREEEPD